MQPDPETGILIKIAVKKDTRKYYKIITKQQKVVTNKEPNRIETANFYKASKKR